VHIAHDLILSYIAFHYVYNARIGGDMSRATTDVLICGAGGAGLVLAIDLARRGVEFRLIDRLETPFAGSRGKGLQPRSLEVFEDLGVLPRILEHALPYPPLRTYMGDTVVDRPMSEWVEPTVAEPYPNTLLLPQNLTEQALRARLADFGRAPEYGVTLTGFSQDDDGVVAELATRTGPEQARARYLVGADGGRSFVRQALSLGFPGQTLPGRGVVADLKVDGLDRDAWHIWPRGPGQMIGLCPLAGTDLFQLIALLSDEDAPEPGPGDLSDWIRSASGREDLVVHPPVWVSAFRANARVAERYRVGRVLLAGDAAHVHPPTGGQGLNTSLQDTYNLGWKLATVLNGGPDSLLDTYESERRPIAASVLDLSTGILARKGGELMKRGRETKGLDLDYADSPLASDARALPGQMAAGERAPDALCRDRDGRTVRLFDLFADPHWTLLAYGATAPENLPAEVAAHAIGSGRDLTEIGDTISRAYDLRPGTWVLVRPDGFIGLLAEAGDEAALHSYLAAATAPARVLA